MSAHNDAHITISIDAHGIEIQAAGGDDSAAVLALIEAGKLALSCAANEIGAGAEAVDRFMPAAGLKAAGEAKAA